MPTGEDTNLFNPYDSSHHFTNCSTHDIKKKLQNKNLLFPSTFKIESSAKHLNQVPNTCLPAGALNPCISNFTHRCFYFHTHCKIPLAAANRCWTNQTLLITLVFFFLNHGRDQLLMIFIQHWINSVSLWGLKTNMVAAEIILIKNLSSLLNCP